MLTELHRRRVTAFKIVFLILTVMIIFISAIPGLRASRELVLEVLLAQFFFGIGILVEKKKLKKMQLIEVPRSDNHILKEYELVIKRHVSWFDEYWIFSPSGEYLGKARPHVAWYAYPLSLLLRKEVLFSTFFGLAYRFLDADGRLIGHFKLEKGLNTAVKIFDSGHQLIGVYRHSDWKSLVNIHGELFTKDNRKILEAKVSGFSGNFQLTDLSGMHWASLSPGQFPLEYRKTFKDSMNPLVKLNPGLTYPERILLLSMVVCWFLHIRRL